jgi:hypothetical protein
VKKEYYEKNKHLVSYFDALHYILHTYFQSARLTISLRDEDISFPLVLQKQTKLEFPEILASLNESIQALSINYEKEATSDET